MSAFLSAVSHLWLMYPFGSQKLHNTMLLYHLCYKFASLTLVLSRRWRNCMQVAWWTILAITRQNLRPCHLHCMTSKTLSLIWFLKWDQMSRIPIASSTPIEIWPIFRFLLPHRHKLKSYWQISTSCCWKPSDCNSSHGGYALGVFVVMASVLSKTINRRFALCARNTRQTVIDMLLTS